MNKKPILLILSLFVSVLCYTPQAGAAPSSAAAPTAPDAVAPTPVATGYWTGDIDGSSTVSGTAVGERADAAKASVTVSDVVQMVAILRGQRVAHPAADLNADGLVTTTDLQLLVDIATGRAQSEWREAKGTIDGGTGLGNGGGAGTTPPPADSPRR